MGLQQSKLVRPQKALKHESWRFLEGGTVSQNAEELTKRIVDTAKKYIPKRRIKMHKSTHPWLTDGCRQATAEKRRAEEDLLRALNSESSPAEISFLENELEEKLKECNVLMGEAFENHVERIREQIKTLPGGG